MPLLVKKAAKKAQIFTGSQFDKSLRNFFTTRKYVTRVDGQLRCKSGRKNTSLVFELLAQHKEQEFCLLE